MKAAFEPALPRVMIFVLVAGSTILGLAGTDLLLPAIPALPETLGGNHTLAQLVLAAFVAGAAVGLLLFGTLASRFDQRRLLIASLLAYSGLSALAAATDSMHSLVLLRFLQGAAGSAAAVFAPGMLRIAFGELRAVRVLGLLGSLESLTPALAPLAGLWLFNHYGWSASFHLIAILAAVLGISGWIVQSRLPRLQPASRGSGYRLLLADRTFMRYAITHACTLGALLVFVLSAPTVFVGTLGASFSDFVILQISGIAAFIAAANGAAKLVSRYGADRIVWAGTCLFWAGSFLMLCYALSGGGNTAIIIALFLPMNAGLGLRGPPGFHLAVSAARGDDARGAALVLVATLATTAFGTAAVAPWIEKGLTPVAIAVLSFATTALLLLKILPAFCPAPAPQVRPGGIESGAF